MRNEEELAILQAYSRGEIGWRETCGALELTSVEMLHDALEKHHLPDPEATASADSEQIQSRFRNLRHLLQEANDYDGSNRGDD